MCVSAMRAPVQRCRMNQQTPVVVEPITLPQLREEIASFGAPDHAASVWQVINSCVPYAALWALLVVLINHRYPLWTLPGPMLLASAFYVRIFILFHDCAHKSFVSTPRASQLLGYLTGILTFTPYETWARHHILHHATYADLDHRGVGDVWTLTVKEYLAASRRERLLYRIYRHPVILFAIGPLYLFLIAMRYPSRADKRVEQLSVLVTNLALLAIVLVATLTIGLRTYLLIQLPILAIAASAGVWLFYVQHQFEGVYWTRHIDWDPMQAALHGSSYYQLPALLQWFTGSIGLHFIHHIMPRIPNYNLQPCYDATPKLQSVKPMTLRTSLHSVRMNLWDEEHRQMVSFRSLRAPQRAGTGRDTFTTPALPANGSGVTPPFWW